MPIREFDDERGRRWLVWDVYPTLIERRLRNAGPPLGVPERRQRDGPRGKVAARLQAGWLAFEAEDGERRRLSPVPGAPSEWAATSEEQLRAWCAVAEPTPRARRLVE